MDRSLSRRAFLASAGAVAVGGGARAAGCAEDAPAGAPVADAPAPSSIGAGGAARELDVVAVSVDPEGDTPAKVGAFPARHDLIGRMDYIVGTRAQLVPIWKAWAVAAQPAGKPVSAHSARIALVDREERQVGAYSAGIPVRDSGLAERMRSLVDNEN